MLYKLNIDYDWVFLLETSVINTHNSRF